MARWKISHTNARRAQAVQPTFLHAFNPFLIISTAMTTLIPIIFGLEVLFVPFLFNIAKGRRPKVGGR